MKYWRTKEGEEAKCERGWKGRDKTLRGETWMVSVRKWSGRVSEEK